MPAYAVGHLRSVTLGPEIFNYIAQIDATLDPYGGRFLIHGGPVEVLDGEWSGDLVVIAFPNFENAHAWYASPEYQAILSLRTANSDGSAFIVDGLPDGYRAKDKLTTLMVENTKRAAQTAAQGGRKRPCEPGKAAIT